MTREEWMKQVTGLVMDINPAEIKSHDTDESLKEWCHAWQTAMNMLIIQAPLEPKRWIPCSEKLPEMAFGCLVTVEEDDRNGEPQSVLYPEFVGYDGETWNNADGEPIPFEVLAWFPLPKPYETQESEG